MVLNKICQLFLAEEVFAKMCHEKAHVRYIKILTSLRGFLVIFLYLVCFFLRSGLFEELRDNGVMKSLKNLSYPLSLGVMLEFS